MTYNNSYVSSSSALKSFASISDDTNDTLKDAKFFEVFSLTYMKDLPDNAAPADCNGNNCIVGCSCNTANGWEPIPASYSTRTSVGIIPPTSAQAKLYVTATTNFKTAYANGKLNSSPAQTSCRKQALPPYFIKISYSTSDKGNNVGFYQPATITTDDETLTSVQIKYTGQIGKVMPSGWQYSATSYTYRLGNNTGEQNYTIPYSPKDVGLEGLGSYLSKPEVSLSLNGTKVIANTRLEEDNSFSTLKNEWPASISFNGKSYDLVFEQLKDSDCPDGYFKISRSDYTGLYSNLFVMDEYVQMPGCYKPLKCKTGKYDYTKFLNGYDKYVTVNMADCIGGICCADVSCKTTSDIDTRYFSIGEVEIGSGLSCRGVKGCTLTNTCGLDLPTKTFNNITCPGNPDGYAGVYLFDVGYYENSGSLFGKVNFCSLGGQPCHTNDGFSFYPPAGTSPCNITGTLKVGENDRDFAAGNNTSQCVNNIQKFNVMPLGANDANGKEQKVAIHYGSFSKYHPDLPGGKAGPCATRLSFERKEDAKPDTCPGGYFKKIDDATGWSMTQASHNLEEIKVSDSLTCYKSKGCKNSNGAYDKSTLKITGNDLTNYINPGPSTKFGNVECLFMSCKDNTILSAEDKNIFSYTTSSKDIATGLSCKTETVNGCRRGYAYNPCTTPKTVNGYRCSTEYTSGYYDIYYRYIYSKDAPKTLLNVYKLEYNSIGDGAHADGFKFDATSSNCKDFYGATVRVGYDASSYGKYSGTKIAVSNLTAASDCSGIVAIPVTQSGSYIPASAGSNQAQKLYPFECTRFYTHTTTRNGPYFLNEHIDLVYEN